MEILPILVSSAQNIGPFAVTWIQDYARKSSQALKTAYKLGTDIAVPFLYVYHHLHTYKGFDRDEFNKIFANKSDDEKDNLFNKLRSVQAVMFAQKEEVDPKYQYFLPRDTEGKIQFQRLLAHMQSMGSNLIKLQVPMLQLMFVPGATQLGKAMGMPEEELRQDAELKDLIMGVLNIYADSEAPVAGESAESALKRQKRLENLENIKKGVNASDNLLGISKTGIDAFIAYTAASSDDEGLDAVSGIVRNIEPTEITETNVVMGGADEKLNKLAIIILLIILLILFFTFPRVVIIVVFVVGIVATYQWFQKKD